ncbi:MAG: MFS transporter [Burkholderiales bacterium]
MRWLFGRDPTLIALVALGVVNHVTLAGNRVTASLEALRMGASPATVGFLLALYALLPMFSAVAVGRWSDRIGVRRPMLTGSLGMMVASALPALVPGFPALFASACLMGVSFLFFQVPTQNATGELGSPGQRAHNFSTLALGYSISGFLGPLVAGLAIDHGGFPMTFALLAMLPVVPAVVLYRGRLALPGPHPVHEDAPPRRVIEIVRHRQLRRVLLLNLMFSVAWELHTIVIPVYGARIGLSASEIGFVLSSFGAATFVVRFSLRWVVRRFTEHQVLTTALFIAAMVYLLFPFGTVAPVLMGLSFCLGLGLGMSQPMVMALLHTHAPPGRMGEAAGVRMSLVQSMSVAVPLAFGALGATVGLTPVFWSVGVCLATGGWWSKASAKGVRGGGG